MIHKMLNTLLRRIVNIHSVGSFIIPLIVTYILQIAFNSNWLYLLYIIPISWLYVFAFTSSPSANLFIRQSEYFVLLMINASVIIAIIKYLIHINPTSILSAVCITIPDIMIVSKFSNLAMFVYNPFVWTGLVISVMLNPLMWISDR